MKFADNIGRWVFIIFQKLLLQQNVFIGAAVLGYNRSEAVLGMSRISMRLYIIKDNLHSFQLSAGFQAEVMEKPFGSFALKVKPSILSIHLDTIRQIASCSLPWDLPNQVAEHFYPILWIRGIPNKWKGDDLDDLVGNGFYYDWGCPVYELLAPLGIHSLVLIARVCVLEGVHLEWNWCFFLILI